MDVVREPRSAVSSCLLPANLQQQMATIEVDTNDYDKLVFAWQEIQSISTAEATALGIGHDLELLTFLCKRRLAAAKKRRTATEEEEKKNNVQPAKDDDDLKRAIAEEESESGSEYYDEDHVPLSMEEMRRQRLAYFCKQ
jgi:hypothetical protein